jgi:hypothetical protein
MLNITHRLFRWTGKDIELKAFLKKAEEDRAQLDVRVQEVARATLDSEGEWMMQLVKRSPDCALKVAMECDKPEGK